MVVTDSNAGLHHGRQEVWLIMNKRLLGLLLAVALACLIIALIASARDTNILDEMCPEDGNRCGEP